MRSVLFLLLVSYCVPLEGQTGTAEHLPEVVKFVAPAYPRYAKDHRMQGAAVIHVVVSPDGQVADSKTVTAHPVFGGYAVTAVQKWKFRTTGAQQAFDVTFDFMLYDEKECPEDGKAITPETYVSAELPKQVTIQTGMQCVITSTSSARHGDVPDEETAVAVAEESLLQLYGQEHVRKFQPYHAKLDDGVWTTYGTLKPGSRGGTPQLRMSKEDGRILEIWHSQ